MKKASSCYGPMFSSRSDSFSPDANQNRRDNEMARFIAEESFWELFPDARLGVLRVSSLDNSPQEDAAIAQALADAHEAALAHVTAENWTDNDVIRRWRAALQKFKTKKGARASIEALLKRVSNGNTIGS